jgi:DNA-binding IclR family transcriptional regulator
VDVPGNAVLFVRNDDQRKLYYGLRPNSAGDRGSVTDREPLDDAVAVPRRHGFGVDASDLGPGSLNPSDPEELISPNPR